MTSILDELRDEVARKSERVSFVRADPKADAYAEVRRGNKGTGLELPDYTTKFLNAIKYPIPDSGQVIFLNAPIFASPGDGKAQPVDAPVLTPTGWKPIGSLRIGDQVIGADGLAHFVTGIFPQGRKETFKVTMSDGGVTECCEEHLWNVRTKDDKRKGRWRTKVLKDIVPHLYERAIGPKASKSGLRLRQEIPIAAPVQFAPQQKALPMAPYLLGALLGDGDLTNRRVQLHNIEEDVRQRAATMVVGQDKVVNIIHSRGHVCGIHIQKENGATPVQTLQVLRQLGLEGKDCFTKFIPRQYLFATVAERWELLRGLMDTDGSVNTRGGSLDFATGSDQLRDDVVFLVRSLGGLATVSTRRPSFPYKGQMKVGQPSHRLMIRFPVGCEVPVASNKNRARWTGPKMALGRFIKTVEPSGTKECVCISVDAPDQLYVTNDFIVTHNTVTALTIVFELIEFYGMDKCSVYISDHLPSLADALRDRATPVQILVVDDALKNYSSRGGGNEELLEAIKLFTTLRHEYEAAQNALNGIVFVMFTSQMYKGLDKVFREGFAIFKSALTSDKDEIMSATKMGNKAWEYLNQILREVKVLHKFDRKSDSVVILPGYPAGRIHLPMWSNADLDEMLKAVGTEKCLEALKTKHPALKYKAIEKAWTIPRRILTKEEEIARINRLMDKLAGEFASEREEDTGTNEGKAALRDWLDQRCYNLDTPPERRISSEDYLRIKVPANFKAFGEKVVTARKKISLRMMQDQGLPTGDGQDGNLSVNQIIDFVADRLLREGLDPEEKEHKERILSRLYGMPPSIRNDAVKLRTAIISRMHDRYYIWNGPRQSKKDKEKAKDAVNDVVEDLDIEVNLEGDYFNVDAKAMLDELIEKARTDGDDKLYRQLMVFNACEHKLVYGEAVIGDPTKIADTEAGQAWQKEVFGQAYSRPEIQKNKTAGSSYFHNVLGLHYEKWIEAKLNSGYVIPGIFDRDIIAKVERGGGNSHGPDITVTYNDGAKDYVSLKCYNDSGTINISSSTQRGKDEVQPERNALKDDEARGITTSRIVVLCRNLFYDGLQAARKWTESRDVPETIGVKKEDIGRHPFVLRGTVRPSERNSKPVLKMGGMTLEYEDGADDDFEICGRLLNAGNGECCNERKGHDGGEPACKWTPAVEAFA